MTDITSPRWLWVKFWLFLMLGAMAAALLLIRDPSFAVAALLALAVWACCRAYYFAFYVIEHYTEDGERYAGIVDFVRRGLRSNRGDDQSGR